MVMNKGVVQQVGTPTEIHDHPAMILVDGALKGGTFRVPNVEIGGLAGPDGPATLGFRAEDAQAAANKAGERADPLAGVVGRRHDG